MIHISRTSTLQHNGPETQTETHKKRGADYTFCRQNTQENTNFVQGNQKEGHGVVYQMQKNVTIKEKPHHCMKKTTASYYKLKQIIKLKNTISRFSDGLALTEWKKSYLKKSQNLHN